jgi:hypothetical protein
LKRRAWHLKPAERLAGFCCEQIRSRGTCHRNAELRLYDIITIRERNCGMTFSIVACDNEFIGNENFEVRADPEGKWIDKPVLEYLVKKFE